MVTHGVLALVLVMGGCSDGGRRTRVSNDAAADLVLQPQDLPGGFVQFDFGEIGFSDLGPGPREDERRFGRQGGWKARYKHGDAAVTTGALVVVSMVDVFADERGAERDFAAYEEELRGQVAASGDVAELLGGQDIGDRSTSMRLVQGGEAVGTRYHTLVWQAANVTASIVVQGFGSEASLDEAAALAHKQQSRIAATLRAPRGS